MLRTDIPLLLTISFLTNAAFLWLIVAIRRQRTRLLQQPIQGEVLAKIVHPKNWNDFSLLIQCIDGSQVIIPIVEKDYDLIHDFDFLTKAAQSSELTISRKGVVLLQTRIRPLPVRKSKPITA